MTDFRVETLSRGVSIGGAVTSGTPGSILFIDSSGNLAQDNSNLFWDDTNNRLGIGTASPGAHLQITLLAAGNIGAIIKAAVSQSANLEEWQNSSGTPLSFVASNGDISVPDEVYGSGWNGSLEVPTKNSVYDKIELLQPLDATLTSIALLGTTADRMIYTTGVDTWAEVEVTPFVRSLFNDVDADTMRISLGLEIGTNVQAQDPTLQALAAYNTNGILTQTAADTFTGRTITGTTNQVIVANGNGVSGNPTLSLPQNIHTTATPQFDRLGLGVAAGSSIPLTTATTATHVAAEVRSENSGTAITNIAGIRIVNTDTTTGNWSGYLFANAAGGQSSALMGVKHTDRTNNYGDYGFWSRDTDGGALRAYISMAGMGVGTATKPTNAVNNLILGGGSATVLGAATADIVNLAAVDNGAGNRELQIQPESGSFFAMGNNRLRIPQGGSTAKANAGGVTFDHFVDAGNTGTGEDDLYSDTIPASTFAVNGDKVVSTYQGVFVGAAASTQELRIYFGGTKIYDSGALAIGVATNNWTVYVTCIRVSSSVVRCAVSLSTDFGTLFPYSTYTEVTGLTLTNTQILKLTGEAAGVGAANNQIVAKLGFIEWKSAA